jgi:hypothetical protein
VKEITSNALYWWNGRTLNANSFFNNQSGAPRPFDNANQWAASFGGPVKKDKTFFFVDTEGLRLIEAKPKEERSSRSPNQRLDLRGSAALALLCSRKERIIAHRAACRYQEPFSSRLRNLGASPRTLRRQKLCGQQPRRQVAARKAWQSSDQPDWLTEQVYLQRIQPRLCGLTNSTIASALFVSKPYAADIRAGRRGPHPRHWSALSELVGVWK